MHYIIQRTSSEGRPPVAIGIGRGGSPIYVRLNSEAAKFADERTADLFSLMCIGKLPQLKGYDPVLIARKISTPI